MILLKLYILELYLVIWNLLCNCISSLVLKLHVSRDTLRYFILNDRILNSVYFSGMKLYLSSDLFPYGE